MCPDASSSCLTMPSYICFTCGTQFPESAEPPAVCAICEDERQYVPEEGQRWTTLDELRASHRAEIRDELHGLLGIGCEPKFAIGQRALLVDRVLWDCQALLNDEIEEVVGRIDAIAISHPHYYTTMVEWARRFGCQIYVHADDREWVVRPDDAIVFWEGEEHELKPGLTLIRLGGHFPGGQVLHWETGGRAPHRGHRLRASRPPPRQLHVQLPEPDSSPRATVVEIAHKLESWHFEKIVGAWWGTVVQHDGNGAVRRSAARYARALSDRPEQG